MSLLHNLIDIDLKYVTQQWIRQSSSQRGQATNNVPLIISPVQICDTRQHTAAISAYLFINSGIQTTRFCFSTTALQVASLEMRTAGFYARTKWPNKQTNKQQNIANEGYRIVQNVEFYIWIR